jgi:Ni2+-binding GTPase involved in maturation of urease and hydrogenase
MKLILTSGFLGAGKTTAIVSAAKLLLSQQKKVAVITNDQGEQQVDGSYVKSFGIPTREVSNGCFCCNYHQLDAHLESLEYRDQPHIIFAEAVGSCTDLIATVSKPLCVQREDLEIVIAVFADVELLLSMIEGRTTLIEESVRYIYKKQLEEADLLILNKVDLLEAHQLKKVDAFIKSEYPDKVILQQNSLTAEGISTWMEAIENFTCKKRNSLAIDYDIYGNGESKLAWLDKSITVITTDGNAIDVVSQIITSIFDQIQSNRIFIGHLKFLVETDTAKEKISFTTTHTNAKVTLSKQETNFVNLLINARVQTNPEAVGELVDSILVNAEMRTGCTIANYRGSVFSLEYPRPIHRIDL